MTDNDFPLIPARDGQLTPEGIADRSFASAKRGYSESEVRAYLRRVADEVGGLLGRERDLAHRVSQLEGEANQPPPALSDQQLISALGEETVRVLGQAREAAVDLRNKAEEHARRVVREAQEAAKELRTTAQQTLEVKTREAEDAARARASEIVGEARVLRERVLTDLSERRQELERQISDLRGTRGKLVDAYETVERALSEATNLMAQETPMRGPAAVVVEAPAPDAGDDTGVDTDADGGDEPVPADEVAPTAAPGEARDDVVIAAAAPEVEREPDSTDPAATGPVDVEDVESASTEPRDVSALFDQLRSEAVAPEVESDDAALGFDETPEAVVEFEVDLEADEPTGDQALLAARDEALAPALEDLARRAKRVAGRAERHSGRGPPPAGQDRHRQGAAATRRPARRWAHVLQQGIDRAYAVGASTVGATTDRAPAPVLGEFSTVVVTPLRDRLASSLASIDEPTPADTEIAIAQRLGAQYREWRSQHLDPMLADVMAAAHAQGVYDSAPEGSRLRWVPVVVGKCPDCDDNALEPTVRGDDFPTGQAHPPAHPGCRCLIIVDTDS